MRIALCDDDRNWLKTANKILLHNLNKKKTEAEISCFSDGKELLKEILTIDLLFIDIKLKEESGIEIVQKINELSPRCFIVYTTKHLPFATEVYGTKHDYFVLKEQFEEKIESVLTRFMDKYYGLEMNRISVITVDKTIAVIEIDDIIYLERSERKTKIVTKEKTYVVKRKIEDFDECLSWHSFIRCHKSFIVNPSYVKECSNVHFIMRNVRNIPISRRFSKLSLQKFGNWLKEIGYSVN